MARVGERIAAAREQRGYSQRALGELLGISQAAISKYENGERRLDADWLPTVAEVLGVPVTSLYEGVEPPAQRPVRFLERYFGDLWLRTFDEIKARLSPHERETADFHAQALDRVLSRAN